MLTSILSAFFVVFLFLMLRRPPIFTLFPYTTLFRSVSSPLASQRPRVQFLTRRRTSIIYGYFEIAAKEGDLAGIDRKSTRLNSSHTVISYAVFCLKKKKSAIELVRYICLYLSESRLL